MNYAAVINAIEWVVASLYASMIGVQISLCLRSRKPCFTKILLLDCTCGKTTRAGDNFITVLNRKCPKDKGQKDFHVSKEHKLCNSTQLMQEKMAFHAAFDEASRLRTACKIRLSNHINEAVG